MLSIFSLSISLLLQKNHQNHWREFHCHCEVAVDILASYKITEGGIKIKRYDERCLQFNQNTLFRTNQRLFYDELGGVNDGMAGIPDSTASTEFWNKIWSDDSP